MKKIGILLIELGILIVIIAFNMEVIVGVTYNIGLLDARQNVIYLSGIVFLAGIILFGFGVIAKEEPENLREFMLWTILTPFLIVATIKLSMSIIDFITNIQETNRKHKVEELLAHREKVEQNIKDENDFIQKKNLDLNSGKFIDNNNGTVTFKPIDLIWQRCTVGQEWTGLTCEGKPKIMNWNEAVKISDKFLGYNDWRLPTKEELLTLVFCSDGKYDFNGNCTNLDNVLKPTINTIFFPNTIPSLFWTSSSDSNNNDDALNVDFSKGILGSYVKKGSNLVRLVRDNK